jgi:hypothetical protein
MAVPQLKLDLAPPSTLWRQNHATIGWAALGAGALALIAAAGLTVRAWTLATRAGRRTAQANQEKGRTEDAEARVLQELRDIDVSRELPRWKLAERIFTERSLPWSRLTAELERSLVQDVRLKSLQRTRSSDMKVQVKVKGEARTREAEADFVESLLKNPFFDQVILEREGERQGGGVDFEYTLTAQEVPPAYTPLPKYGPAPRKAAAMPAKAPLPAASAHPVQAPARPRTPPPNPARPVSPGRPPVPMRPGIPGQPPVSLRPGGAPFPFRTNPAAPPGQPPRPAPQPGQSSQGGAP